MHAGSQGWYITPDWIKWHPEYDRPLGEPLGDAVKKGDVWTRQFKSGTNVTFDAKSNIGKIYWSSM